MGAETAQGQAWFAAIVGRTMPKSQMHPDPADSATWRWELGSHKLRLSANWWSLTGRAAQAEAYCPELLTRWVHPSDAVARDRSLREQIQNERELLVSEYRLIQPDGHVRTVVSRTVLLRDKAGRPDAVLGFDEDASSDWAQGASETESDMYRLLAENATEGLAVYEDGLYRFASPTYRRMMGYSATEVLRVTPDEVWALFHPEDLPRVKATIRSALKVKATHIPIEFRIRRRDGQYFWRSDSWYLPYDPDGVVRRVFVVAKDITQQVNLRQEVEQAHGRLHALFDRAPNGIMLANDEGQTIDVNPAICRLLGYERAELLEIRFSDVVVVDSTDPGSAARWSEFVDRRRDRSRITLRRKDGSLMVAAYTAVAHIQPGVHLSVLSDVTEQVTTEVALNRAQDRLRQLAASQRESFDEFRRELAQDVHDELGQTLSALRIEVGLLKSQVPQACEHLLSLVDAAVHKVRDVSRTLRPAALDLGLLAAIQNCVRDLGSGHDMEWEIQVPRDLLWVPAYAQAALFRIAQESLSNAWRHAGATRIRIGITVDDVLLAMSIDDNGCGFDPRTVRTDVGLGLAGMADRAQRVGAKLDVRSRPGKGTAVRVELERIKLVDIT